jgi:hypothetical protein
VVPVLSRLAQFAFPYGAESSGHAQRDLQARPELRNRSAAKDLKLWLCVGGGFAGF